MKKLTINRETLRDLNTEDLNKVVGGYPPLQIPVSDESGCNGGGSDPTSKSFDITNCDDCYYTQICTLAHC